VGARPGGAATAMGFPEDDELRLWADAGGRTRFDLAGLDTAD
jgi:hypothetical protein